MGLKNNCQKDASIKYAKTKGITLIDLIIALVVIGILMAIAYPCYLNFLLKIRRFDALATLAQDQILLERCYAQNNSYNTCSSLPRYPHLSAQEFYRITITNLGTTTYTLVATPRGNQKQDSLCTSMSLDQSNSKIAVDKLGAVQTTCWNLS